MNFCAHAIFYHKLMDRLNDTFLVWENVYFIVAENSDAAWEKAEIFAKNQEDLNERRSLKLNDEDVMYLFSGIRKIIELEMTLEPIQASGLDCVEITYSVFEVDNIDQVHALANGEMVEMLYRDE